MEKKIKCNLFHEKESYLSSSHCSLRHFVPKTFRILRSSFLLEVSSQNNLETIVPIFMNVDLKYPVVS